MYFIRIQATVKDSPQTFQYSDWFDVDFSTREEAEEVLLDLQAMQFVQVKEVQQALKATVSELIQHPVRQVEQIRNEVFERIETQHQVVDDGLKAYQFILHGRYNYTREIIILAHNYEEAVQLGMQNCGEDREWFENVSSHWVDDKPQVLVDRES